MISWVPRVDVRLVAASLAFATMLSACSDPSETELLNSSRDHLAKKDVEAARLELKTLLQKNPESAEARFLLGKVMHDTGDLAGAEVELRRALEGGYSETKALPLLADAMVGLGKGPLLLQQYGQATLPDAQADAELKTRLAKALAGQNDRTGARELLDQVLQQAPEHPRALLVRARLSALEGDWSGALKEVDGLLARRPDDADAWLLKGDLLMRGPAGGPSTDTGPAAAAYKQALLAKPDNVAAHVALITLALGRNDAAAANAQWTVLQKVAPRHPQTLFFEAVLAEQKGDYTRSRELAQLLLRGARENPQLLMLAGQAELRLNGLAQAEAHFAMAMQLLPGAAAPRRQLALVQLRSGQVDKALATLRPLVDGKQPDAEALSLASQAQMLKGDNLAAEASLAMASKLKPGDPRLGTAMALSSLAKGNASALNELQAIAASDTGTTADMALINVLMRRNDLPGALKAVEALAVKLPGDAMPDQLRARIALQRQDPAGARKAFEAALAKNGDYLPAAAGLAALDIVEKQPVAAAKARFEALLQRNPNNSGALMALADIGARSGDKPEQTSELLSGAIKADPGNAVPRRMLVDLHLNAGRLKLAQEAAQAGVTALPGNPDLLERLGRIQLASGQAEQAVITFGKLAALAPRSAAPQLRLADAHAAAKNQAEMAAAVRRAAELAPDTPLVQQAQMNLALQQNKLDQALAIARKVQALRPDDAAGFSMEGEVELRRGHWDAAANALRKAVSRTAPGDSAVRLHGALLAGKKMAEADQFAADWHKRNPNDLAFVLYLGDRAVAGKNPARAESFYAEVLARQPANVTAMNNQAYVLAMQKKPGAVALAEKALQYVPRSPSAMDTLAFALAADNQLPRAIEVQTEAVAAAPEAHRFRLQLARLQLQAGDKPAARIELEKLAKLGSAFARQAEVAALLKETGG